MNLELLALNPMRPDGDNYWTVERAGDGLFRGVICTPTTGTRITSRPLCLREAMLWARESLRLAGGPKQRFWHLYPER